jgi:hypothetical protein
VLPSIVDLEGVDTDWEFDGHSLFNGGDAHTVPIVSTDVEEVLAIAAERGEEFPNGDGWTGLAAVGSNGDLVGERVADLEVGQPSALRASLEQEALLARLPTDDGAMPFALAGTVSPPDGSDDEPPELLVALNGTLAGVVGGYRPAGGDWSFVGYVADFYREGANVVELYEVARDGPRAMLHLVQRSP